MTSVFQRVSFLHRYYFNRSGLDRILLLSCFFSIGLCAFRILYTGQLLYASLCWNLFLAWLPLAVTGYCIRHISWIESTPKFLLAFMVWLLLIPNSFYILTDLFHLRGWEVMPLWFDLALILSFAWNGLLLGVLSVRQMEKMVRVKFGRRYRSLLFIYPIMWLNAWGIYIGRYLRFNSWDVITDPFDLARNMIMMSIHPVQYRLPWSMIFCFSILMTFMYLSIKQLRKSL